MVLDQAAQKTCLLFGDVSAQPKIVRLACKINEIPIPGWASYTRRLHRI